MAIILLQRKNVDVPASTLISEKRMKLVPVGVSEIRGTAPGDQPSVSEKYALGGMKERLRASRADVMNVLKKLQPQWRRPPSFHKDAVWGRHKSEQIESPQQPLPGVVSSSSL